MRMGFTKKAEVINDQRCRAEIRGEADRQIASEPQRHAEAFEPAFQRLVHGDDAQNGNETQLKPRSKEQCGVIEQHNQGCQRYRSIGAWSGLKMDGKHPTDIQNDGAPDGRFPRGEQPIEEQKTNREQTARNGRDSQPGEQTKHEDMQDQDMLPRNGGQMSDPRFLKGELFLIGKMAGVTEKKPLDQAEVPLGKKCLQTVTNPLLNPTQNRKQNRLPWA